METMTDLNNETVDRVQKLCKLCHDSSEGFRTAADNMDSSRLTSAFLESGTKRQEMRDQLASALGTSHEDIPDGGTMLGTAHRWWLDARAAISSNDDEAVLKEAARGERAIEEEYEDALLNTAGSPVNRILQRHLDDVKTSRKRIESLGNAAE